jgi:uncharacterized LabA/DUF88 family protein
MIYWTRSRNLFNFHAPPASVGRRNLLIAIVKPRIGQVAFSPEQRLAILIDGTNFYGTLNQLGFEIDFLRLLAFFRQKGKLVRALYYSRRADAEEESSLRQLLEWLAYNGFTLVTKPATEFPKALGQRRIRSKMHVELAIDALQLADHVDHFIVFTGNAAFRPLVAAIQLRGCFVSVASTPPMTADELRRQADHFIDLADLEPFIGRVRDERPNSDPHARGAASGSPTTDGAEAGFDAAPKPEPGSA